MVYSLASARVRELRSANDVHARELPGRRLGRRKRARHTVASWQQRSEKPRYVAPLADRSKPDHPDQLPDEALDAATVVAGMKLARRLLASRAGAVLRYETSRTDCRPTRIPRRRADAERRRSIPAATAAWARPSTWAVVDDQCASTGCRTSRGRCSIMRG